MLTKHKSRKMSRSSSVESSAEGTFNIPSYPSTSISPDSANKYTLRINETKTGARPIMPNRSNLNQRKSSKEKNVELTSVKIEDLGQVENSNKMSNEIKAKNLKIAELEKEVTILRTQVKQSEQKLSESNSMKRQLLNTIQSQEDIISGQKITLENLRIEGFAQSIVETQTTRETDISRYMNDIYESRERITAENINLRQTVNKQKNQLESLQRSIDKVGGNVNEGMADYIHIDETTLEDRSKSELLNIIRCQMDDKIVWVEYAIKLTHEAVTRHPQLLEISSDPPETEEGGPICDRHECRWARLAISALKMASKTSPQILNAIIKSADQDQKNHIQSSVK